MSAFLYRKNAPLHYSARSSNAKFSAYCLYSLHKNENLELNQQLGEKCKYGGTPSIALYESFLRESAIALELILKACIIARYKAETISEGFPQTHNIPQLWLDAKLPSLEAEDQKRLQRYQQILEWSGRYPTAKSEARYIEDLDKAKMTSSETEGNVGKLGIYKLLSLRWEHFERIYDVASDGYWEYYHQTCPRMD